MASSADALKDLDITREELNAIGTALKDDKFRKLLCDYVEEVNNPEYQKQYEEEITQLEKERGNDVTFIKPIPGYVIKTSAHGSTKCFVNICANDNVEKPSSFPTVNEGSRGLQWNLPHLLTPPRKDIDRKNAYCLVYDVLFHPTTLQLAHKSEVYRKMVNDIACETVEKNFDVKLDVKNLKFPKMKYKGTPKPTVIRKALGQSVRLCPEEQAVMDKIFESIPKGDRHSPKTKNRPIADDRHSNYTTPTFVIKHRSHLDVEDFTEHKMSKLNIAIPKELIVEVNLPLLKVAGDVALDVTEKTVHLISEKPAKYELNLTLPYHVWQDNGNAKFDKDRKKLVITLPVRRKMLVTETFCVDSGVDSDHGSPPDETIRDVPHILENVPKNINTCNYLERTDVTNNVKHSTDASVLTESVCDVINLEETSFKPECSITNSDETSRSNLNCDSVPNDQSAIQDTKIRTKSSDFMRSDVHYTLPESTCHMYDETVAFTLHVKNVDEDSLRKSVDAEAVHVCFMTISSGFFPIYYSFYCMFAESFIKAEEVSVEVWDNNVVVQLPLLPHDGNVSSYFVGADKTNVVEKFIEEPSIINTILMKKRNEEDVVEYDCETTAGKILDEGQNVDNDVMDNGKARDDEGVELEVMNNEIIDEKEVSENVDVQSAKCGREFKSNAIDIGSIFSESSGDELSCSCSYSPSKCRGILKRLPASRRSVSRSMSESGIDDVLWTSSVENCHTSLDSVIPEDVEPSGSFKKTVRFNDVVLRQLYRSNSSILGQKKKNQRKARNKKRAHDRRHSESELSELEDKKDEKVDLDKVDVSIEGVMPASVTESGGVFLLDM